MKRTLLLASFLGLAGSILLAQNAGGSSRNTDQETDGNGGASAPRTPWAQVLVTPGPQGPVVNSYIAPWPLGTALQDSFSQSFLPPGLAEGPGSPQAASSNLVIGGPSPGAEAGQDGGTGAQTQTSPPPQTQPATQTRPAAQTRPATQAQSASSPPGAASSSPQDSKRVIVVPSPVHYDRAGRRVIDPSWQETMYQMIEADREAQRAAQGTTAQGAAQGAEVPESAGSGPEAQDGQIVRETVFVVPGPAIWRIRGTLTVAKGMIALEDDDGVLWYLPGLDRYIGFIDGLDAGEQAALEGYAPPRGSSQERYFQPIRLFIDEMEYDLAVPPEGVYLGGQTTIIREIERPAAPSVPPAPPPAAENQEAGDRRSPAGTDPWWDSPASVWQHNHTSPWAPPASILDFTMDYDSFWREDPAKQERRDRDSREIWY